MANYLTLDEAAKKLGISAEKLVALRSGGQIRGFRDGTSWKFAETEITRLKDELPDLLAGSSGYSLGGLLSGQDVEDSSLSIEDSELDLAVGDFSTPNPGGSDLDIGSEINLDMESLSSGGSDVNLVASEGEGSDVAIVPGDSDLLLESGGSDLLEIDSGMLNLNDPAILHDSAQLDLAIEPNAGSTGPVTDQELKEISESHPDVLPPQSSKSKSKSAASSSGKDSNLVGSDLDLAGSDFNFGDTPAPDNDDSGEDVIGEDLTGSSMAASSLELMSDLDGPSGEDLLGKSRGADVLSELDLLSAEQHDSGLISGDSESLLASSGLGSSLAADALADSGMMGLDDALADDDDLVIADDDDDLVISNAGSDISVAGDSGINLMSPSDSGLSLESEPLDLAGSSISALDLGAELAEGGSNGSDPAGSGSLVDFQADEEFQLSPSGIGLDADIESASQVIEIEESGEAVAVDVPDVGDFGGDVFGEPMAGGGGFDDGSEAAAVAVVDEDDAVSVDTSTSVAPVAMDRAFAYEVPFTLFQCLVLLGILLTMSLGGILMTDLVRNMWTFTESSPPVSSLTNWLIDSVGLTP
jgi:excisionase family DNA binding protein